MKNRRPLTPVGAVAEDVEVEEVRSIVHVDEFPLDGDDGLRDQAVEGVALAWVAREQGLVGDQLQQNLEVRVELSDHVLRFEELHSVSAVEATDSSRPVTLAGALCLSPQADGDLRSRSVLRDPRLTFDEVVEVRLVAAADDLEAVV